jgi:hypothetical protein
MLAEDAQDGAGLALGDPVEVVFVDVDGVAVPQFRTVVGS